MFLEKKCKHYQGKESALIFENIFRTGWPNHLKSPVANLVILEPVVAAKALKSF